MRTYDIPLPLQHLLDAGYVRAMHDDDFSSMLRLIDMLEVYDGIKPFR